MGFCTLIQLETIFRGISNSLLGLMLFSLVSVTGLKLPMPVYLYLGLLLIFRCMAKSNGIAIHNLILVLVL